MEVERKYLIEPVKPGISILDFMTKCGFRKLEIEQYYLHNSAGETRMRKMKTPDDTYYILGIKSESESKDTLCRVESEVGISKDVFDMLVPSAKSVLKKTRYIPESGISFDFMKNIYGDDMCVLEVEWPLGDPDEDFLRVPGLVKRIFGNKCKFTDVTGDPLYRSVNLSKQIINKYD